MLSDSAHIQQSELKRPAKLYRKKEKIGPLYTQKDVRECLSQATTVEYDFQLKPHPFVQCRFRDARSEEHTSELQSRPHLVCRLLLEKKKKKNKNENINKTQ